MYTPVFCSQHFFWICLRINTIPVVLGLALKICAIIFTKLNLLKWQKNQKDTKSCALPNFHANFTPLPDHITSFIICGPNFQPAAKLPDNYFQNFSFAPSTPWSPKMYFGPLYGNSHTDTHMDAMTLFIYHFPS